MSDLRRKRVLKPMTLMGMTILSASLLVGMRPVQATDPEPTLMAMALFGRDDQESAASRAKSGGPKPAPTPETPMVNPPPAPSPPAPSGATARGPAKEGAPAPAQAASLPPTEPHPMTSGGASGAPPPNAPKMDGPSSGAGAVPPQLQDLPPAIGEGYAYDPRGRRDPFLSIIKLLKDDKARADLPPLQRIEISDMKLMGIVWAGNEYYGLLQTPDGKGYTVREGMLVGTNNGVVKSISEKRIVVSEPTLDFSGKKTTREIEILQRPKEGVE